MRSCALYDLDEDLERRQLLPPSRGILWRDELSGGPRPLAANTTAPCPDLLASLPASDKHASMLLLEQADPTTLLASVAGAPAHVARVDVVLHHSNPRALAR